MLNPRTMHGWKRPVGIEVPYVMEVNRTQNAMKMLN
jgi:hypothetical protein